MDDKRPKGHNPTQKSLQRWENEGGAPKGVRKRPRDFNQAAKLVIDIATGEVEDRPPTPEEQGKDPAAAAMGRKGGVARAKAISARRRTEIAKKAAVARWKKD
jgi:hypothetical protein